MRFKYMNEMIGTECDYYIQKCKMILDTKDAKEAIQVKRKTSDIFEKIIPNWHNGLMAMYTGFYLDDIEVILGKLCVWKSNINSNSTARPYYGLNKVVSQMVSIEDSFEQVIESFKTNPLFDDVNTCEIVRETRDLQEIAESQISYQDKWDQAKSFLQWLMTQNADVAVSLLPLILQMLKQTENPK